MNQKKSRKLTSADRFNSRIFWIISLLLTLAGFLLTIVTYKFEYSILFAAFGALTVAIGIEIRWLKKNLSTARNQISKVGNVQWQIESLDNSFKRYSSKAVNDLAETNSYIRDISANFSSLNKQIALLPSIVHKTVQQGNGYASYSEAIDFLYAKGTDGLFAVLGTSTTQEKIRGIEPAFLAKCYFVPLGEPLPMSQAHGTAGVLLDVATITDTFISPKDYFYWTWLRYTTPIIAISSDGKESNLTEQKISAYSNGLLTVIDQREKYVILGRKLDTGILSDSSLEKV